MKSLPTKSKRGWVCVRFGSDYHVVPCDDLIEHEQIDCVCGPADHREDDVWLTVHHSLDGREFSE